MASRRTSWRERRMLRRLRRVFREHARGGKMDAPTLRRFLGIRDDGLFQRFFAAFDRDGNGTVDEAEFLGALGAILGADDGAKLRFIFDLHDAGRRGSITRPDFTRFIELAAAESRLDFTKKQLNDLAWLLFRTADTDQNGSISFDEFAAILAGYQEKHGGISLDLSRWIEAPPARKARRTTILRPPLHRRIGAWFSFGDAKIFYLALYLTANIVLFLDAKNRYAADGANLAVQIARGCGAGLNFNGALILVPVMRNGLTWLRGTFAARMIPLDEHLEFHKLVGQVMFALALVHTGAHLYNYSLSGQTILWHLRETAPGLSGAILLGVFALMWVGAQSFIRRSGWFEVFAVTHTLYLAWFGLMLWHGPRFWKSFWLPGAAYLVERLARARRRKFHTPILDARTYPSGVTNLRIERPPDFTYRPADYMFVRIRAVSRFEWHPFTISSSPGDGELGLHVRSLGNWSRALFTTMLRFQERRKAFRPMAIDLDGPYGTPSTHLFESPNAVLIAAGIGATPFASILRTIQLRRLKGEPMPLKRAHFIWLAGDQFAFEWFLEMLAEIEASAARDLIDIQIYMTEFKRDLKTFTLDLAIDLLASQAGADVVTGLRAKTKLGRPDWNAVFAALSEQHRGERVDVYFCGPPALGGAIRPYCQAAGFRFRREIF